MPQPISSLSDYALIQEYHKWDEKIKSATSWGAALAAADEFRKECKREVDKRNLLIIE